MSDIEWTDETWNPTDGCEVCSPGCANCYAMRFAGRFAKPGERYHGLVTIGKNKRAIWTGKGRLDAGKLAKPLHWRKPRRIFVNSMSDLFYEEFTNEEIAAVFGVMAACPQHTFQILTKRAKRMREWFEWVDVEAYRVAVVDPESPWWRAFVCIVAASRALGRVTNVELKRDGSLRTRGKQDILSGAGGATWPLRNVWEGVSVENPDAADERIPELQRTPAAIRFLSCEPLLGPLYLTPHLAGIATRGTIAPDGSLRERPHPSLDWVIAGCESGPGARPAEVDWYRSLRDQCKAAGVPFFLKQAEETADLGKDGLLDIGDDDSIAFGDGSKPSRRQPYHRPPLPGWRPAPRVSRHQSGDTMISTFTVQATKCSKCGHQHAGRELAFICVGCPCHERPQHQGDDTVTDETETMSTPVSKTAVISIHTDVLEAVARWAGTDESRPHLHQVLFTKDAMVAVDGHRMVIVPCETFGMTIGVDRQYLLAAVAAQRMLKGTREITIAPADSLIKLGLDVNRPRLTFLVPASDTDAFPPYKQVVRDSEKDGHSGSPVGYGFNPKYMAAIAEVDAATCDANDIGLGNRGIKLTAWSTDRLGAMVFVNQAGVKFLIMPMRI